MARSLTQPLLAALVLLASNATAGGSSPHSPQPSPITRLWEARLPLGVEAGGMDEEIFAVRGWIVHVGAEQVTAFDAASGTLVWQSAHPRGTGIGASVQAGDRLFVLSADGAVWELAWGSGSGRAPPSWRFLANPSGLTPSEIVVAGSAVVVSGWQGDPVVALDAASGRELWRFPARPGDITTTDPLPGSLLYVTLFELPAWERREVVLSVSDGRVIRGPSPLNGPVRVVATDAATAILARNEPQGYSLWRVEARTGRRQWTRAVEPAPLYGSHSVAFGAGGTVWSAEVGIVQLDGATGHPTRLFPYPRGRVHLLLRAGTDHLLLLYDGQSLSGDGPGQASVAARVELSTGRVATAQVVPAGETIATFSLMPGGFVILTHDGVLKAFRG